MPANHHYVPQFYLRRFADDNGCVWVWDKFEDRTFKASPENIATEKDFYLLNYLQGFGPSAPLEMEKQFSLLESDASEIFSNWEYQSIYSERLEVPIAHREVVSLFVVSQLLRTREARSQVIEFFTHVGGGEGLREILSDPNRLHADIMWDGEFLAHLANHVRDFIWIPASNHSEIEFLTSDHPVLIKSGDNKQWIMGPRLFDPSIYIVYPLSPTVILYMYEPKNWRVLQSFDCKISPVNFTAHMVNHENSGQVGMCHRFVYSSKNDFKFARQFARQQPSIVDPNRARYELYRS